MNFFAEQDRARRNTLWLVVLMIAAVVGLILVTSLAVSLILHFSQQPTDSPSLAQAVHRSWLTHFGQMLQSDLIYYTAAGVLAVVVLGSTYKLIQLGGSGRKVAEALGGRIVPPNTHNAYEKKILNIVEEMAIASGNPVPQVYVLEEPGINAFAAGTDRRNAVIGITRGALELLNRDELQGVVAHEFSHIHNGDMRLNLRLVAILHGILVIGLIGSFLLRSSHRRSKNQGAQLGLGLTFLVLGYCGVFFGNLIKAAVSRQRELLADASAVQFTRNPGGVANALKKIGGHSQHALLGSARATEYSHMYFGDGVKASFGGLFATHPPLPLRIRKIEPRWDGKMILPQPLSAEQAAPTPEQSKQSAELATVLTAAVATIGNPQIANIDAAHSFLQALPQLIYDAAHEPFSCRALIYCLLLDSADTDCRSRQLAALNASADSKTMAALEALQAAVIELPRGTYLQIVDLAVPALKTLSASQYQAFKQQLTQLIKADAKISLMEWCLYRIVTANCEDRVHRGQLHLKQMSDAVVTVLLKACESGDTVDFGAAFAAAAQHLPGVDVTLPVDRNVTLTQFDQALKRLEQVRPLEKPQFLKALAACIQVDNRVTDEEMELFRALADCLNCPVPLLKSGPKT